MLRFIVLSTSCQEGMWHGCDMELDSLVCSCSSVLCASSPLLCSAPQRALLCLCVSGPRAPQPPGPQGEGMVDLMMYRKSEDPHGDPSAAIGQHCALEAQPTVNSSPVQKACGNTVCGPTQNSFAQRHVLCCYTLGCSTSPVTSAEVREVSARQDREQKGWN